MAIRFSRSASRHGMVRDRSRFVVDSCSCPLSRPMTVTRTSSCSSDPTRAVSRCRERPRHQRLEAPPRSSAARPGRGRPLAQDRGSSAGGPAQASCRASHQGRSKHQRGRSRPARGLRRRSHGFRAVARRLRPAASRKRRLISTVRAVAVLTTAFLGRPTRSVSGSLTHRGARARRAREGEEVGVQRRLCQAVHVLAEHEVAHDLPRTTDLAPASRPTWVGKGQVE